MNGNSCSAGFPSTGGSHCATSSVSHCQVILSLERSCVSLVRSRSNSVRDRSAASPTHPYVLDARATALRRRGGNGVTGARHPRKRLCRSIGSTVNGEGTPSQIRLHSYLNGILSERSVLGNRSVHCDRSWIVRARVRTGAAASPAGKTVTHLIIVGWSCTNRDSCPAVCPPTRRTNGASGAVGHRQVILRRECRCVGLVSRRRNSVRDPTVVTPSAPQELNASGSALRGNCRNGVARTARPRKRLCRTVTSAVNREREAGWSCLNSHLDGGRRCSCWRCSRGRCRRCGWTWR